MSAPSWVLWMADHFTPEQYLFWTRWQCLFWTVADLLIVIFLIRLSNCARSLVNMPLHRFSYVVLLLTVPLVPCVLVAPTGGLVFLVELCITVPHFLLLCYLLIMNIRVYAAFLPLLLGEDRNRCS